MTDEIKPIDVDGMPCHSDECPKYDGKRCGVMGFQPDRLCEPSVKMLVEANLKLGKSSRELAFLLRGAMERDNERKRMIERMEGHIGAMAARVLILQAEAMKAERWERAVRKIAVHGTTKDILSAMQNGDLDEIEKLL